MSYTPPKYPTAIPTQTGPTPDLPNRIDDLDWLYAARYNELKLELLAALTELGVLPKGSYADVAARLTAMPNPAAPANGDIIIRSGGAWISLAKGTDGQVLTLVSGLPAWAAAGGGGFNFRTGDLLFSFNLSAPSGFTDISTTYDAYFIRISKDTPLSTGGSNTHSHTLGETNLPSHSHGYGTIAAAGEAAHTHGVGSIAAANEEAHTHTIGTLAVGAEAAHTHAAGSYAVGNEASHTHSGSGLSTSDPGNHTHSFMQGVDLESGTNLYGVNGSTPSASTGAGAHTHSITGNTGAGSSHTHSFSGSSAAGSSHTHGLTGAPGAGTAHTHSLSGSTAAGSSHTHTISGSTAAVGSGTSFSGDNVPVWLGVRCYQKD